MEQYFARVFTQAQMSQLPLACRRGGGACLGLHGDAVSASGALKWTVAGVPSHWGPGTFQQWLEKQGWTEFKHVTAPKHTKGKWTCVAKPAETGEGPFAYQVGEQVITITKWMRAKPVANERWHAHGSKWFTVDGKEQEEATEVMEVDRQEVPTTVPDSPTAATQNEPGNGKTASPSKHTPKRAKLESAAKPTAASGAATSKRKVCDAQNGPRGTTTWNLGGHWHGDCGYRAIAAACAARSGKSTVDIEANIETLTKSIKARCIAWLKQHREWEANWATDPTTDEDMEDGVLPKTAEEYLTALSRANRWIDGLAAQAIASCLQTDLLIFEKRNGKWKMCCRIQAEESILRDPLVLCLAEKHYATIVHDKAVMPKDWKSATPNGNFTCAAGKTASESSWLKPASVVGRASSVAGSHMRSASANASARGSSSKHTPRSCASDCGSWFKPGSVVSPKAAPVRTPKRPLQEPRAERVVQKVAKASKRPKSLAASFLSWPCPYCEVTIGGRYSSVISSKRYHAKTRHPDKPLSFLQRAPVQLITASAQIPPETDGWKCPLCDARLPKQHKEDRKRSIRDHIEKHHPDETPTSLFHRGQRGRSRAHTKVGAASRKVHRRNIKKKHPTHEVVAVTPHEKNDSGFRGCLFYCKKCLTALPKGNGASGMMTCAQKRRYIANNLKAAANRRTWWIRIQQEEPRFAASFSEAVGKSFRELDDLFKVHVITESAQRWADAKAKRAKQSAE